MWCLSRACRLSPDEEAQVVCSVHVNKHEQCPMEKKCVHDYMYRETEVKNETHEKAKMICPVQESIDDQLMVTV